MDDRFPLYTSASHRPPSSVPGDYEEDDEDYRYSRSESSVRFPPNHRSPLVQENVFATPPGSPAPSNVFATPVSSRPPSPLGLDRSGSGLTPSTSSSIRRDSSFSRRSPSPVLVANGGYFPRHGASASLAPSIMSTSSSGQTAGSGLGRSNTVTTSTTNNSALYSIPSQLSQFSSPPSPLPSIAPVRPRFDYGGHQQSIYPPSVQSSSDIGDNDPFGDGYEITVPDGFAPYQHQPPPSITSSGGLPPPPYSRYPDLPPLEPDGGVVGVVRSNPDSGVSMGSDDNPRGGVGLAPAAGVDGGEQGGSYHNSNDDASGAGKEWKDKTWLGLRAKVVIVGIVIGLLFVVGLGVGLGMGLGKAASESQHSTSVSLYPTSGPVPPSSEETGPAVVDPNSPFPPIKTGLAVLSPRILTQKSSLCHVSPSDPSAPTFFTLGSDFLWSCQHPNDKPLLWQFDPFPLELVLEDFPSIPNFLREAEYGDGKWGGFMLTSAEGIERYKSNGSLVRIDDDGSSVEYSLGPGWRDGTQNPEFWHVPLAFYDHPPPPGSWRRLSDRSDTNYSGPASYRFGILYNKTVVLKSNSIRENTQVLKTGGGSFRFPDGTPLVANEIVWKCIWEKTLLEVVVDIGHSSLASQPDEFGGRGANDGSTHSSSSCTTTQSPSSYINQPSSPPTPPPTFSAPPDPDGSTESVDDPDDPLISKKSKRTPEPYPLKISISESRPGSNRLRRVMGLDLTDPDPDGYANLGDIKCTRMVVTNDGGLKEFVDSNGEGFILLQENEQFPRKRDPGGGCCCRWST